MKDNNIYKIGSVSMDISEFALQAMLYEVSCFPSPGLVSPISNGAHKDMDFYTFIDSSASISRYFMLMAEEGYSEKSYDEIFKRIKQIGVEAEKHMFSKTNNVNTHKGMIFLIGIICAAAGKVIYKGYKFSKIRSVIVKMTEVVVKDELLDIKNKDENELSHGEKLYKKYKFEGIRGEVAKGIPTVFDYGLDFYKRNKDMPLKERLVQTLFGIMQVCDDSTIIHRHSIEVLNEVKEISKNTISIGGMRTSRGRETINNLSREFINRNISPGGSADLLAATVLVDLLENYMEGIYINNKNIIDI